MLSKALSYSNFCLKILFFVRANNSGKSYSILIERGNFRCTGCDEFLERVQYIYNIDLIAPI